MLCLTASREVITVLKSIGAADAMLASVGPALGKYGSEGFEVIILAEAEKVRRASGLVEVGSVF